MKKIICIFLFVLVAAGAFCQNGVIRELTGEVEIRRAGAADFVRASAGDTVALNTVISTVTEGRVNFSGTSGPAVMVTAGNESFAGSNGAPADPAEVAVSSLAPSSPVGAPPAPVTGASQPMESIPEVEIDLIIRY